MAKRIKAGDRQAVKEWDALIASIKQASSINPTDSDEEINRRKKKLEADPNAWRRYYFAQYYTAEPAAFHLRAAERFRTRRRMYEVRAWARELGKTATTMMDLVEGSILGFIHNVLYVSNSYDNAERLLMPIKAQFEANQRLIQDYGEQTVLGQWESGEFRTRSGCSFRALGAGQSPRGTRHKNYRPDCIVFDDIDTDEETRNPDRIEAKWKWIERATLPSMSVSGSYRILFLGNIIAPSCCIQKAIDKAKTLPSEIAHVDIINIRDEHGRSVWAKNSEEDIDMFLSLISFASAQAEFFNNPISEGEVFKELSWGICPPLAELEYCVVYADPSPSNKGKGSMKAVFLVGVKAGIYYVYKGYLDFATNALFIDWLYDLRDEVGEQVQLRYFVENNSLQDPFFEQVLQPLLTEASSTRGVIPLRPDTRKKPDKFDRIEGNLEPLNRTGRLILNIKQKHNPHMLRLEEQFLLLTSKLKAPADGPDCIEGGWYILNNLLARHSGAEIKFGFRGRNSKRY
ncbi:MAG: hypothetical protein SPI72_03330 [Porphyromonas sp.]|nr:hypothetical protein [Porphyromonas sp.]